MLFIQLSLHRKKEKGGKSAFLCDYSCSGLSFQPLMRLFTNVKQLMRQLGWHTFSEVFSRLEVFCFYCTYVLPGYGAAVDTRLRKAEGNHVVSNSWLLLGWFFQHLLSTPLPQKKYFSSIFPSLVSSWIWNVPVIEPVFFLKTLVTLADSCIEWWFFSLLEEWSYTVRLQPVQVHRYRGHYSKG